MTPQRAGRSVRLTEAPEGGQAYERVPAALYSKTEAERPALDRRPRFRKNQRMDAPTE